MQGFSLPGESQKAAKILASFLGELQREESPHPAHTQLIRPDPARRSTRYLRLFCNELKVNA